MLKKHWTRTNCFHSNLYQLDGGYTPRLVVRIKLISFYSFVAVHPVVRMEHLKEDFKWNFLQLNRIQQDMAKRL